MRKIGFIGAYDKTDLIVYVAKILTELGQKVLVVDSTVNQKARYIVPAISPAVRYITDFEDIDIAIGFHDMEEIEKYSGEGEQQLEYDIALIDVDNSDGFKTFELVYAEKNYFVTCFDNYSLKKGLETLIEIKDTVSLTKILFTEQALKEDDDYLNFLSLGYKVIWNEFKIFFPMENGDLSVIYENQRLGKIKFKKLSVQYKDGLSYIVQEILEKVSEANVRKAIKTIEKNV